MTDAEIVVFRPSRAMIGAHLHMHMSFGVVRVARDVKDVNVIVRVDRDRRIGAVVLDRAVGNRKR